MSVSRNRKEWKLPVRGDWVVVRAWDVEAGEETQSGTFLAAQLRGWAKDVFYSRVLVDIGRTLWGGFDLGRGEKERWTRLLPRLEEAFRRGTLVLVKRRAPGNAASGGSGAGSGAGGDGGDDERERERQLQAAAASSATPRKPKTWVAIRLMDQDGQPIAGEAYKLVLPDGTVEEGCLDETGEAFVNGIDPGECQISFPKLDGKEWKPA